MRKQFLKSFRSTLVFLFCYLFICSVNNSTVVPFLAFSTRPAVIYKNLHPTRPAGRPDPQTSMFSRKRGKTISGTLVGSTAPPVLPHVLHILKILLLTSVIDYGERRWRPRNIGKPVRRIAHDSWK